MCALTGEEVRTVAPGLRIMVNDATAIHFSEAEEVLGCLSFAWEEYQQHIENGE